MDPATATLEVSSSKPATQGSTLPALTAAVLARDTSPNKENMRSNNRAPSQDPYLQQLQQEQGQYLSKLRQLQDRIKALNELNETDDYGITGTAA